MDLTSETYKIIRKNKRIKARLMLRWDIAHNTIQNWLNNKNPLLCHPDTLAIISNETGKMIPELVTEWDDSLKESIIP